MPSVAPPRRDVIRPDCGPPLFSRSHFVSSDFNVPVVQETIVETRQARLSGQWARQKASAHAGRGWLRYSTQLVALCSCTNAEGGRMSGRACRPQASEGPAAEGWLIGSVQSQTRSHHRSVARRQTDRQSSRSRISVAGSCRQREHAATTQLIPSI
ncbi:hypothetical protein BO70DRAFT_365126 [Aspergillus heteromorphus CBS 117.55]|uniref:Uncharacterized protein n=1 Tax=Aspergillus heteromorphus CBS 117.55 TaxID=1448321 RepID=A0A317VCK9_9EURO|nr:uncharacterized protein BO70DRAFT_365126 [Aspergillus heteromorphus CBS 117.55]PWY71725.1 hypothetical protein BO70DRAFT_365126 [Aspergillus heteromorphus CBS 117.55]